jgi:hypothetical protein
MIVYIDNNLEYNSSSTSRHHHHPEQHRSPPESNTKKYSSSTSITRRVHLTNENKTTNENSFIN